MSTSVTLPALGESVTEGTVSRWLKQVGDTVEADEPLLEVSTDKVDTEIPSPAAGVLLEIRAQEDETVEIGAVLAVIGDDERGRRRRRRRCSGRRRGRGEHRRRRPRSADDQTPAAEEQAPAAAEPSAQDDGGADRKSEAPAGGGGGGTEITLPALGESVTEGTVSRWLKQVGDSVAADEPLLEISTDKVDTEIPSPAAGVLLEIRVQEDETVEVGAVLAVVGEEGAAPSEAPAPAAPESGAPEPEAPEPEAETAGERPSPRSRPRPATKVDRRPFRHRSRQQRPRPKPRSPRPRSRKPRSPRAKSRE